MKHPVSKKKTEARTRSSQSSRPSISAPQPLPSPPVRSRRRPFPPPQNAPLSRILLFRLPPIADKTESSGSDVTKKIGGETREKDVVKGEKGEELGKQSSRVKVSPRERQLGGNGERPSACGLLYRLPSVPYFHVLLRLEMRF